MRQQHVHLIAQPLSRAVQPALYHAAQKTKTDKTRSHRARDLDLHGSIISAQRKSQIAQGTS